MPSEDETPFFAPNIEGRIEACAGAARAAGRRVNAYTAVWHLFMAPLLLFAVNLLRGGRLLTGYTGFRESVHKAVFLFTVNARIYELTHADHAGLNAIKKEFE